jgi:hypothetical protein
MFGTMLLEDKGQPNQRLLTVREEGVRFAKPFWFTLLKKVEGQIKVLAARREGCRWPAHSSWAFGLAEGE